MYVYIYISIYVYMYIYICDVYIIHIYVYWRNRYKIDCTWLGQKGRKCAECCKYPGSVHLTIVNQVHKAALPDFCLWNRLLKVRCRFGESIFFPRNVGTTILCSDYFFKIFFKRLVAGAPFFQILPKYLASCQVREWNIGQHVGNGKTKHGL